MSGGCKVKCQYKPGIIKDGAGFLARSPSGVLLRNGSRLGTRKTQCVKDTIVLTRIVGV